MDKTIAQLFRVMGYISKKMQATLQNINSYQQEDAFRTHFTADNVSNRGRKELTSARSCDCLENSSTEGTPLSSSFLLLEGSIFGGSGLAVAGGGSGTGGSGGGSESPESYCDA